MWCNWQYLVPARSCTTLLHVNDSSVAMAIVFVSEFLSPGNSLSLSMIRVTNTKSDLTLDGQDMPELFPPKFFPTLWKPCHRVGEAYLV